MSGSFALVEWLHVQGWSPDRSALVSAAGSGSTDILQWLMDHGLPLSSSAMRAAVCAGHVHVVRWLNANGCEYTSELLLVAVERSTVEVVDLLFRHCAPADGVDLLEASCRNPRGCSVFEYLADKHGLESDPSRLMAAAAKYFSTFDAAVLVKRYGVPLHRGYMKNAIQKRDIGRLRFALSQGTAPSAEAYMELIEIFDGLSEPIMLAEVLDARTVNGVIPDVDRTLLERAISASKFNRGAMKLLADRSFFDL